MELRVRQLIPQLSYSQLVLDEVIPDIGKTTPQLPSKRYPKWIYDLAKIDDRTFPDLGLFVEEIIWNSIAGLKEPWPQTWTRVCQSPAPPELNGAGKYFGPILATYQGMFNGCSIQHNHELKYKNISGHPDFFSQSGWILDVKTTTGFAKMAEESYLQIMAYATLARENGVLVNHVGLILPVQRMIVWYNLTGWNHQKYLEILAREAQWRADDLEMLTEEYFYETCSEGSVISPTLLGTFGRRLLSNLCGGHISKADVGIRSQHSNGRPIQIFLGNPQAKVNLDPNSMVHLNNEIKSGTRLYIHASYLINLGVYNQDRWDLARTAQELSSAHVVFSSGVVIHVGKYKGQDPKVSLKIMEDQVRTLLQWATPQCPLILETSAGEGTELCSSIESLMEFYSRFDQDPRFKVCLDSAHVSALGYDPAWYLEQWVSRWPKSITLVHFNDSAKCRGSRVDAHYYPGLGHVGYKRLARLHDLCEQHEIPMVRE